VKGAALFSGYAGPDCRSVELDSGGWFRTGDAGQVNEDGSVSIFGRADDTIVTGGTNVAPAEVERFLESLPQVGRAAVLGIPDAEWGEVVAAALEVRPGDGTANADRDAAVDDAIRRGLATFQRPRIIVWTDRLPETAAGKLDRPALREWVTSELASERPRP
jgi:O-succinylbenzoic acid--CoA ligase